MRKTCVYYAGSMGLFGKMVIFLRKKEEYLTMNRLKGVTQSFVSDLLEVFPDLISDEQTDNKLTSVLDSIKDLKIENAKVNCLILREKAKNEKYRAIGIIQKSNDSMFVTKVTFYEVVEFEQQIEKDMVVTTINDREMTIVNSKLDNKDNKEDNESCPNDYLYLLREKSREWFG